MVAAMKWPSLILLAAIPLALSSHARADDISDCDNSPIAPGAAIAACTRLLDDSVGETSRRILILRSRAYAAKKEFDAALADTDRIAVIAPGKFSTVVARADVHNAMKDYDAAVADYTEFLKRNPQNYFALSNRCFERSRSNRDASEALADCDAAVAGYSLGRPGPDLCTRGIIYLRLGRLKEALADYNLAINNRVSYAQCYYGRGIAELRLGDTEGGKADVDKGLAIERSISDWFSPFGLTP